MITLHAYIIYNIPPLLVQTNVGLEKMQGIDRLIDNLASQQGHLAMYNAARMSQFRCGHLR